MGETRTHYHIRGTRSLLMNAFSPEADNGSSKKGRAYNAQTRSRKVRQRRAE